ncbi:MAG: hypothetical protein AUH07_05145 [Gemmatimonadetes bacterium 13_2_20CM_70_9]|nr:MAG: hypothetical protein AUH07_05145 [Gemmatimonadetes bacterium 13_2_20CM_70_9]PYP70681.1 MAG: hypothetical protein DMD41_14370 [Gemmatimonadota bacterium]
MHVFVMSADTLGEPGKSLVLYPRDVADLGRFGDMLFVGSDLPVILFAFHGIPGFNSDRDANDFSTSFGPLEG